MDLSEMMKAMGGAGGAAPPGMDPAGMRAMQQMMEAMTSGDPQIKKQMEGYWKMLDGMAQDNPDEYNKFIDQQMKEMKECDKEEEKKEEQKWVIQSTPYFAFCVKPAKILEQSKTEAPKPGGPEGIKLFDFGQSEEIKESFAANVESADPLDGPKLYVNIVSHDQMLPPLSPEKDFADPNDDANWQNIPVQFSVPIKRRNLANIDCWHFDCHVNTCVIEMMKKNNQRFRAIWNYIILRFQHHVKQEFVLHKRSIKLCKKKKYKNPLGNGQTVRKFTLAKHFHKDFFAKQIAKAKKQAQAAQPPKPKDVNLSDIISGKNEAQASSNQAAAQEDLKELNLPGGKSTKAAAQSAAAAAGSSSQGDAAAAPKKPIIVEMKERPGLEVSDDPEAQSIKLTITVELEKSAKDIDLDISEHELRLESQNYELRYKFLNGVTVDPDSCQAKFSKKQHTLTLTLAYGN